MDLSKKPIIGIITIVSFLYIVLLLFSYLQAAALSAPPCSAGEPCPHKQQLDFLLSAIPLFISLAVLVGALTYYFMLGKIEGKEKSLRKNTDILLKFLNADEKKAVNKLIEGNGRVLQAEISRLPGMNKVKSHRVIQRLIDRGVIEKESFGKTNIVKFTKEIQEGLL